MRKLTGTLDIKVSKCLLIIMKEVKIFMKKEKKCAGIHEKRKKVC